jgi:hypothetical protein
LIPNPIRKVLSSMRAHRVRALLMGGQACVFYGAAEFSRDTDFAILADAANLARLRKALAELQAELIAVPPFAIKYLRRGHAIHFRCQHPEALRMRVERALSDEESSEACATRNTGCGYAGNWKNSGSRNEGYPRHPQIRREQGENFSAVAGKARQSPARRPRFANRRQNGFQGWKALRDCARRTQ